MNSTINEKLLVISRQWAEEGRLLPRGVSDIELSSFLSLCLADLAVEPPDEYLELLKVHNGFAVEGIFVYSTARLALSGSTAQTLAFVEMNTLARELDDLKDYLAFGDCDQDEYVLKLSTGKYQVRDKQAFDNVYEEFERFDDMLEFMLDHVLRRVE